jgi:hypothetical protein
LQIRIPVETGVVMMLAIYSAGWKVDAPLFFALPPLPRVDADLWGMQISFVAAKAQGGEDLDYLCWQWQIAEAITFTCLQYISLQEFRRPCTVIRVMFIFEYVMD